MNAVEEAIRDYVLPKYLPGEKLENLRSDTPLITSGILDSMAVLDLVTFLEDRYGVRLDIYDTAVERFDLIRDIATVVLQKQAAAVEAQARSRT